MAIGLIGRKRGMTRVFTEAGDSIAVSVVEIEPNRVAQVKDIATDGYRAIQIATGQQKALRVNKPMKGHLLKAQIEAAQGLWEFSLKEGEEAIPVGTELKVDTFSPGQTVDVSGVSKGKGFAGVIKRHNFSSQNATHGNSLAHNAPGSIGQNQSPGRVFKGKKMAGQMGNKNRTVQNLSIAAVDSDRNLLLIKGAIPGAQGGYIVIKPAVKSRIKGKKDGD